ncbi:hypothetical protein HMPREF1624_07036 [Sporothrix schenckii ATCC 58251]|uniref:FAD-binding PCMH-type domain-containing protein n=1 Tax=Sporothrix schenckii (strain ATCC 58251 / de Perez 2211183) TaxID=1391915 RepID=U7PMM1_SPOS1|nr:hypothetical protein HMPREF1624_07036 [Sporothrix schenckii ATCC 58251]
MAPGNASTAATLGDYLAQYPAIKYYTPNSPDFAATKAAFISKPATQPFAIARPQSAADVQALIRFCVDNDVDFVVRVGGHDTAGRSQIHGVLTIDLRDLNSVVVDEASKTVKVGGGALLRDVSRELGKFGLATPVGTVGSVGYTGWATLGGYGPFAPKHGPGVDQILSVRLVNPAGELVELQGDDELLTGLRGGGGIFGVIVETTAKAFPLKEIVAGMVVSDPSDLHGAWTAFSAAYQGWRESGELPAELYLQPFGVSFPGVGHVFALGVTWAGEDHDAANQWVDKVAGSLGKPPIVKQAAPTSVYQFAENNEKNLTYGVYGRVFPLNFKKYTPAMAAVFAKYNASLPTSESAISIHALRTPPANEASVFGAREDHAMLEVIAVATDPADEQKAAEWAKAFVRDLRAADPDNVLESTYVSLGGDDDSDNKKIYGAQYDRLVALKNKYDPKNIFKHAIPKLASY